MAELQKATPDSDTIPELRSSIEELQKQRNEHLAFRSELSEN